MPEFMYEQPPELVDRIADLCALYSFQTGADSTFESELLTNRPVGHREFFHAESGELLTVKDVPDRLQYVFQAIIERRSTFEDGQVVFEDDEATYEAPVLSFGIDYDGVPFLYRGSGEYQAVSAERLVKDIDNRLYGLEALYDWRQVPDDDNGGLEALPTPHAVYTLAAGTDQYATRHDGRYYACLEGDLPDYPRPGEGALPYAMTVWEEDNPYDASGFNRIFTLTTTTAALGAIMVKPLGEHRVIPVIDEQLSFGVGREGVVVRYRSADDSEVTDRRGVLMGSSQFLINLFRYGHPHFPIS
jgi:hypothetical protein